ncbi:MAG: hypothetical protein MI740_19695 [Halanaerobiales bacterium]|nr:hypothetical protein [Halanaerobiales bacterium]
MIRLNLTYFIQGISASNFAAAGIAMSSGGADKKIFFHDLPTVRICS